MAPKLPIDDAFQQPVRPRRDAIIVFARAWQAERLVAGVPAAARAARAVSLAGLTGCRIVADAGWHPTNRLRIEVERLCGTMHVQFGALEPVDADPVRLPADMVLVLDGTKLPSADQIARLLDGSVSHDAIGSFVRPDQAPIACARVAQSQDGARVRLDAAGKVILRATAKPGDGIVSRNINRPVSRAISSVLLRFPGIRPLHATFATAVFALAMVFALTTGTRSGQVWGALLFQAASIVDGVDGEIARATFHTSRSGAMIDSVVDAFTNLAFVFGLALNLAMQGHVRSAAVGFAGLCVLAVGLALIGRISAQRGGPFTFDVIKDHYRSSTAGPPSRLMRAATFITSRDFFALVFVVTILAGFSGLILELFAAAALLWLIAVVRAITAQQR